MERDLEPPDLGPPTDDVLDHARLPGEDRVEASLRPRRLGDFVGQPRVRRQLELVIQGALHRSQWPAEPLESPSR